MCAISFGHKTRKNLRAIILLSGGLDSTLAAHLIKQQGIELLALNFTSPFCLRNRKGGCSSHGVRAAAEQLDIKLETLDNTNEMLECVKRPQHGYGSNMNPCIDCRIVMLRKARQYMQEIGACFIITGEVLGQRPMSQRRPILRLIEKETGLEGLILRPLCAKSLEETIPEKKGIIDREKLLNIVGRGRKEQMAFAREFGINDYPCPAGGCLLTDPNFARRLKDLLKHNPQFSLNDVLLLKLGRHFRISENCKLVVGRNEKENNTLINLTANGDFVFSPQDRIAGPTAIGRGRFSGQDRQIALSIVTRYCDREDTAQVRICIKYSSGEREEYFDSPAITDERLVRFLI